MNGNRGQIVGAGAYATVTMAHSIYSDEKIVAKVFSKTKLAHSRDPNTAEREYKAMFDLCFPQIPKVYDFVDSGLQCAIFMEYVPGITLSKILEQDTIPKGDPRWKAIFRSILDILSYLAEERIVHSDISPSNIVIDGTRAMLIDFGCAHSLDDPPMRTILGTANFIPPEVIKGETFDCSRDIWAFGCILYLVETGELPFDGATNYIIYQNIEKLRYASPTAAPLRALLAEIFHTVPSKRPSPKSLLFHPYFAAS